MEFTEYRAPSGRLLRRSLTTDTMWRIREAFKSDVSLRADDISLYLECIEALRRTLSDEAKYLQVMRSGVKGSCLSFASQQEKVESTLPEEQPLVSSSAHLQSHLLSLAKEYSLSLNQLGALVASLQLIPVGDLPALMGAPGQNDNEKGER